mmetsp:Transcript_28809/g.65925  ORF Transcript_28809/g.65925 Transcript_28809/m.65925 type:complete len:204 (+) Transcript_28809:597-1208(+)
MVPPDPASGDATRPGDRSRGALLSGRRMPERPPRIHDHGGGPPLPRDQMRRQRGGAGHPEPPSHRLSDRGPHGGQPPPLRAMHRRGRQHHLLGKTGGGHRGRAHADETPGRLAVRQGLHGLQQKHHALRPQGAGFLPLRARLSAALRAQQLLRAVGTGRVFRPQRGGHAPQHGHPRARPPGLLLRGDGGQPRRAGDRDRPRRL